MQKILEFKAYWCNYQYLRNSQTKFHTILMHENFGYIKMFLDNGIFNITFDTTLA